MTNNEAYNLKSCLHDAKKKDAYIPNINKRNKFMPH